MSSSCPSSPVALEATIDTAAIDAIDFATDTAPEQEFGSPETVKSSSDNHADTPSDEHKAEEDKSPKKKRKSLMKPKRLSLGGNAASNKIVVLRQKMQQKKPASPLKKKRMSKTDKSTLESKSDILPVRSAMETTPVAPKTARRPSITKPVSPKLQLEKRLKENHRSLPPPSQDQLVEKLEEETRKKRMEMKKAQRLYQKLKQNGFHESKSVSDIEVPQKKITVPKTPDSKLDKKFGKKVPSLLRKSPAKEPKKKADVKKVNGLTVPEPFHFQVDQRVSTASSNETLPAGAGLTAAELAQKFLSDPRHFSLPNQPILNSSSSQQIGGLTVAHAPVLQTELRSKSAQRSRPLSREEKEDQEMQQLAAKPFKARPIDRRILYESAGEIGVPKVQSKPLTEPVGFELTYDKVRASHHVAESSSNTNNNVPESAFKARPVPNTLRAPAPLPPKKEMPLTLPKSPKLNGKDRASSAPARRQKPHHTQAEQLMQQQQQPSAHKIKPVTQPQEFSFQTAARGAHYQAMLEEKIQREQAQLQAYLQAMQQQQRATSTKMMKKALTTVDVPPRPAPKDHTVPQPFQLSSMSKHEEAQEKLRAKKLQEEQMMHHQASAFKAKPVPKTLFEETENILQHNLQNKPAHEPVQPLPIQLESDVRAEKRRQFDLQVAEKQASLQESKKQAELKQQEAEQRLLQEMRRKTIQEGGLVFKAHPVGVSQGFSTVKKAKKVPESSASAIKDASAATATSASMPTFSAMKSHLAASTSSTSALAGGARRLTTPIR